MNQQETFNWMVEELASLRAELTRVQADATRLRHALEEMLKVHDAAEQYPHPMARAALADTAPVMA